MTKNLTDAVDEAASVAAAAGMNSGEAVAEAQQLSAAVVESADGAYLAWTAALSLEPSASVFFATAARGRRFRAASTPLLNRLSWTNPGAARQYAQALTEVCQASAHLAPTDTTVAAAASAAAQAQASAVTPSAPSSDPMSEFSARGPEVLDQVLTRLNEQSARVAQLRGPTLDLQGLDPHSGGAFDLTGQRRAPAVTPQHQHRRVRQMTFSRTRLRRGHRVLHRQLPNNRPPTLNPRPSRPSPKSRSRSSWPSSMSWLAWNLSRRRSTVRRRSCASMHCGNKPD